MSELIKTTGVILSASPVGDQDKRIVIETCELGRITAFARGCRRPGSPLLAAANPFVMGEFTLAAGSSAYRLCDADIKEYFRDLTVMQPGVYVGFYFLDLIDYYGREGIPGTDMLNLLFISLKMLLVKGTDINYIRRVFELRIIAQNGEYAPNKDALDDELYALADFITRAPLKKLFSYEADDALKKRLGKLCDRVRRAVVDTRLKSLDIMECML